MAPTFRSLLTFVLFTLAASLAPPRAVRGDGPFPDKNLETAIRGYLFDKKDPSKELSDDDLKKIFVLEAKGKGIKDLTGLDKCSNLELINLAQNELGELAPIKGLVNLQSLDLSHNHVSDATPLAGLTALQYLELSGNQITSVEPLAGLTKLASLYLAENKLSDIAPLAKLERLSSLDLAKNQVSNLAPLTGFKGLSLIKLSDNAIEDIAPLAQQTQVRMLFLERNKIKDLAPLVAAAKADAAGAKNFAPFLRLYIVGNPLSDAAKSEQLKALEEAGVRIDPK